MKIDHVIIGTNNYEKSVNFYKEILFFKEYEKFIDTGTGVEGTILVSQNSEDDLKLLIVPFDSHRIPNPQHIAFQVQDTEFELIYTKAESLGFKIRSQPSLKSEEKGIGFLESNGNKYRNFYILDPANINIEILIKVKENKINK